MVIQLVKLSVRSYAYSLQDHQFNRHGIMVKK